jgi:hypothetical protein
MGPIEESSTDEEDRPILQIRAKKNILRPKYLKDYVVPKKMNAWKTESLILEASILLSHSISLIKDRVC